MTADGFPYTPELGEKQARRPSSSSFGMFAGTGAGQAEITRFGRFGRSLAKVGVFSGAVRRGDWGGAEAGCWGRSGRGRQKLTGVVGGRPRQAEPKDLPEGNGLTDGVGTAVEVANSVEPFDGQS